MIAVAYYLLKVMVCSGILFLYYQLFLRNKVFHQWNRFYLLTSVLLSIALPFIRIDFVQPASQTSQEAWNYLLLFQSTDQYLQEFVIEYNTSLTTEDWLLVGYSSISLLLLIVLVVSIAKVIRILRRYKQNSFENIKLLSTREPGSPFSFLHYIIWNEEIPLDSSIGQQIFYHELVHVQQKHTWDKLFMQVVLVALWCNPFFWLIRKELRFIHEFIADQKAVGNDTEAFSAMILQSLYPNQFNTIVNPFFQSSIKRRLHMLTRVNNPRVAYLTRLVALPLIATIAFTICVRTNAQEAPTSNVKNLSPKIDSTLYPSKKIQAVSVTKDKNSIEVYYADGSVEKMSRPDANKKGVIIDGGYNNFKSANGQKETAEIHIKNSGEPPLFIIDGKEVSKQEVDKLDPNKIATINVLKGSSAAVLYGEKGKNGVVEVKTRNILVDELIPTVKEEKIDKKNSQNIEINETKNDLNEVVVKGYRLAEKPTSELVAKEQRINKQLLKEVEVKGYKLDKKEPLQEVEVRGYHLGKEPIFEKAEFSASIDPSYWRRFLESYSRPIIEELGKTAPSGKYTVLVRFIVEKDGSLSGIEVVDDPGYGLGPKVTAMMKHAPRWKPAIQNERVVRSYHTQPITFVINNGVTITKNKLANKALEKTIKQLVNAQENDVVISFTLVKPGMNKNQVERLQLQGENEITSVRKFLSDLRSGDIFTVQQIFVSRNGVKTKLPALVYSL